jgi:hypothetical protein
MALVLDGGGWLIPYPWEKDPVPLYKGLGGLQDQSGQAWKILSHQDSIPQLYQLTASWCNTQLYQKYCSHTMFHLLIYFCNQRVIWWSHWYLILHTSFNGNSCAEMCALHTEGIWLLYMIFNKIHDKLMTAGEMTCCLLSLLKHESIIFISSCKIPPICTWWHSVTLDT